MHPKNMSSADNTVSDSSLHSDIADVNASENSETSPHTKRHFESNDSEKGEYELSSGPATPESPLLSSKQELLKFDVVDKFCSPIEANGGCVALQKEVEFEDKGVNTSDHSNPTVFNEKGVNTSYRSNPSVSCQYDCNQNEIPADESVNANETKKLDSSESSDIKFTLSLHIECEWNDNSTSSGSSPITSNFRCNESNCNVDQSSIVDDSFENSDAASPSATACRHNKSLYILKDFKQNYPKFIQYSDFSPKIKSKRTPRKCPITPKRCKRGSVYPGKNCRFRYSREFSAEDDGYHRYSRLSADMPSHQSTPPVSPSSNQGPKSTNAVCNCDFKSTMTPLKASTPTEAKKETVSATPPFLPNSTSLEEFELLESLLETE